MLLDQAEPEIEASGAVGFRPSPLYPDRNHTIFELSFRASPGSFGVQLHAPGPRFACSVVETEIITFIGTASDSGSLVVTPASTSEFEAAEANLPDDSTFTPTTINWCHAGQTVDNTAAKPGVVCGNKDMGGDVIHGSPGVKLMIELLDDSFDFSVHNAMADSCEAACEAYASASNLQGSCAYVNKVCKFSENGRVCTESHVDAGLIDDCIGDTMSHQWQCSMATTVSPAISPRDSCKLIPDVEPGATTNEFFEESVGDVIVVDRGGDDRGPHVCDGDFTTVDEWAGVRPATGRYTNAYFDYDGERLHILNDCE